MSPTAAVAEEGSVEPPAGARRRRGSIGGAAAILLGGFVASRLLGLLRDVLIGARFGTSSDYDLYVAAFRLPDTVFTLVAGGALGSAIVPIFSEYLDSPRLSRLASSVFNLILVVGGAAAALGIVFAPQLVPLFGGFSPEQQVRLALLVRVLFLQPVFFGIAEVLSRYLNVHHHFLYPALAPAVYNLAIIAGAVFLGPSLGTLGLAIGVTTGALLYFVVQIPESVRWGFRWQPALDLHDAALRQIALLMLPRMVGQGAVQLSNILTTRIASYLPTGSLSALYYAFLITMLPLGTFAMSIANAAFPTLSVQAARGERDALAQTIRRTLGTILFLMIPSALGLVVLGLPLIQAVFQRRAFTSESSQLTATALAFYAVGLPAHGAIEILARGFYALKDTRTPVTVGVAAMIANIVLAYALVGPMGHAGIALALTVATTAEAALLLILLARRLPDLSSSDLGASVARTVAAGAALAVAGWLVLQGVRAAGLPPLVQAVAASSAAGVAFLAVAYALKTPELDAVIAQVRRRLPIRLRGTGTEAA